MASGGDFHLVIDNSGRRRKVSSKRLDYALRRRARAVTTAAARIPNSGFGRWSQWRAIARVDPPPRRTAVAARRGEEPSPPRAWPRARPRGALDSQEEDPVRPTAMRPLVPVLILALLATLVPAGFVSAAGKYPFQFQNPQLPLQKRIDDLLGRLTLDEKVSLLHQFQPAIPRLGIPEFKTGTEALHGVAWTTDRNNGGAVVTANGTVFPQAIGLASTWDPALIQHCLLYTSP